MAKCQRCGTKLLCDLVRRGARQGYTRIIDALDVAHLNGRDNGIA